MTLSKNIQFVFLALALSYSALIIFFSAQSNLQPPDIGFELSDKLMHFIEYFIFSMLWCCALLRSKPEGMIFGKTWRLFVACALFAASDEIHQAFVPGRQADILDFVADLCGISVGVFVFFCLESQVETVCERIQSFYKGGT